MIYLVLFLYSQQAETTAIELTFISEVEGGRINFALYDESNLFMKEEISSHSFPIKGKVYSLKLQVPNRPLAITAYHDLDENKELNTNLIGIPNEPYGFSNNARGTFGPPSFSACTFDPTTKREQTIYLK